MAERKVLNKYYPPDYDPSKIPRVKKKNKQNDVRIMAPFNMKCNTCGNYIANATKFNAKKETVENERYNNLLIFRFYIKCPRCMAPIILRTNLKEQGYEVEHGATENFMALKMAERQARDEAQAEEEEEKINPMKHLENRTKESKKQMEASEQIQNLRAIKYKFDKVDLDTLIESKSKESDRETLLSAIEDSKDDSIRQEARELLKRKKIDMIEGPSSSRSMDSTKRPKTSESSNKLSSALSKLKKTVKLSSKSRPPDKT